MNLAIIRGKTMKFGDRRDIRPFLIKIGVAFTLSLAGFLYSRLRTKRTKPSLPPSSRTSTGQHKDGCHGLKSVPSSGSNRTVAAQNYEESYTQKVIAENSMVNLSPSGRHIGDDNGLLLPEFNDLVKECDFSSTNSGLSPRNNVETPRSDVETPRAFVSSEKDDYEQEVKELMNMVTMLRERERNLEVQLLEYYGLKEQETVVVELQNRLKISNMEAKLLTLKIESLQSDKQRLEEQVTDHAKTVTELEAARSKIKLLKKKLRFEAEQNREQILTLQKKVAKLQEQEQKAAPSDSDTQSKLERLKVLEGEAEELRKSNMRLQQENSELAQRLESTRDLAISALEDPEAEALKEASGRLKQENETLMKEVEKLQSDKCAGVEELVYLKWINACLRYELRNYQPPAGRTVARDLSKTLSPKSEEKAKQLIIEYANTEGDGNILDIESDRWSSSQASVTDSDNLDDSSADKSSASKTNSKNKSKIKFFKKLRELVRGKEVSTPNLGSSVEKYGYFEDSDSPHSPWCSSSTSSGMNAAAEMQNSRVANRPISSSRHSFDIQRLKSAKQYDLVDEGSGLKRFPLPPRGSAIDLTDEIQPEQDDNLHKFAEVLKGSRSRKRGKIHRDSSSFSFG